MTNYQLYINGQFISEISGDEFAYAAYRKALKLADLLGITADLVDGDTGEVLITNCDFDDED